QAGPAAARGGRHRRLDRRHRRTRARRGRQRRRRHESRTAAASLGRAVVITVSAEVAWGVAGLLLLAGELVSPGVFLMWIGIAALGVAGLTWIFEIGVQIQILAFAALALIAGFAGWRV